MGVKLSELTESTAAIVTDILHLRTTGGIDKKILPLNLIKTMLPFLLTTKGDIVVRGTTVAERIAAVTTGKVLTAKGVGNLPVYTDLFNLLTTKGDLWVRGVAVPERLAAGAFGAPLIGQGAGELPIYEQVKTAGINKSFTGGNQTITNGNTWVVPSGIYVYTCSANWLFLQVNVSASWRESAVKINGGTIISDGINVRFRALGGDATIYYLKLD